MHLNLDKPFVFFGLLFAYPSLFGSKEVFNKKAILYSAVPLFSLLLIAWWIALYRPSFHCQVGGGCFC
ncbi:membrane protein precursor [Vibrio sp. JCM 19236]|nr:membrane protein precursor [Vibrio sp. JCM 19236]